MLDEIECPSCHVICRSQACLERHRLPRPRTDLTLCEKHYRCPLCNKKMPSDRKTLHTCGEYKCPSCTYFVQPGHLCFHRALPPVSPDPPKYIFYDFETFQYQVHECEKGYRCQPQTDCPDCTEDLCRICRNCLSDVCGRRRHVPNLVVAHTVCPACQDPDPERCEGCGSLCPGCTRPCPRCPLLRRHIFHEARDFFVCLFSKRYAGFTCIAHNAN